MFELLDVAAALSLPIKAAWLAWIVCGAGLTVWYRRGHVEVVRSLPPAVRQRQGRPAAPRDARRLAAASPDPTPLETAHVA